MKKVFNILLLTALLLSGCNLQGNRQIVQKALQAYESEARTVKAESSLPVGLEIPAPLTDRSEQILYRKGYTVSYNADTRLPNWVAWVLTAVHTSGPYKRDGIAFHPDEDVDGVQVDTYDYMRSGYDRGHMCPSGDCKWSQQAQEESFLMTNICPQNHNLNVGDWNEMENQCRRWAEKYGRIYIVAGPILFKGKHKTIGKHKVVVPDAFFKVVLFAGDDPMAIGFIYRNRSGNRPKGDYVNTVEEVERITGIKFFPKLKNKKVKSIKADDATLFTFSIGPNYIVDRA